MRTTRCGATMAVVLAMAATAPMAGAAEANASLSLLSGYVWRGQVNSDEAVAQPSFTAKSASGLSLNAWANMDLTDNNSVTLYDADGAASTKDADKEFWEYDLTLAYALPLKGPVSASIGAIQYTFPVLGTSTREVYGTLAANTLLTPTLSVYYDFDAAEGFYGNIGIGHSFTLAEPLTLGLNASIGYGTADYNDFYFGVDDDAMNDVNVGATLGYAATKSLTISASVTYTTLPDGDISDGALAIGYDDDSIVVYGVAASYNF